MVDQKRTPESPLVPPREDFGVNYKQVPLNLSWLPGSTGFRKRPGTRRIAGDGSDIYTAIARVKLPANSVSYDSEDKYPDTHKTLLWNSTTSTITELQKTLTIKAAADDAFGRALEADDTDFFYYPANGVPVTAGTPGADDELTVAELMAAVPGSQTVYTGFNQDQLPASYLRLSQGAYDSYSTFDAFVTTDLPRIVSGAIEIQHNPSISSCTAVTLGGTVFISGMAVGNVLHYDGFRVRQAFVDMSEYTPGITAQSAGALTGVYQWFATTRRYLPNGEIVESEPTATVTLTLSAENASFDGITNIDYSHQADFTGDGYLTSASTGAQAFLILTDTVVEATRLHVGERLVIVRGDTGAHHVVSVTAISGQTVYLDRVVDLGASGVTIGIGWAVVYYRTEAGGSLFYEVQTTVSDTGATALYDSVADVNLGDPYSTTDFTRTPIPIDGVFAIAEHQGRLCALAVLGSLRRIDGTDSTGIENLPVSLRFSSASSAYYFPLENATALPLGKVPVGLQSLNDVLYVFFDNCIYTVTGKLGLDDNGFPTYTLSLLTSEIGCVAPRSFVTVGDELWFLSQLGLTSLSGNTFSTEAFQPVNNIIKQLTDPRVTTATLLQPLACIAFSIPVARIRFSGGNFVHPLYQRSLGYGVSTDSNHLSISDFTEAKTLIYDLNAKKWALWDIDLSFGAALSPDDDMLFIPKTEDTPGSYVHVLDPLGNWCDNGEAFTLSYYTPWQDEGDPGVDKSYPRLAVFSTDAISSGQYFDIAVTTERNWVRGVPMDQQTDEDGTLSGFAYGEGLYGDGPYGGPGQGVKVFQLSNQRVKSIRAILENSQPNRDFAINGTEFSAAAKYTSMLDA